ncbi:outer membrane protein assembly factor BamE domain-containing protein [Pseudomonas segetis]
MRFLTLVFVLLLAGCATRGTEITPEVLQSIQVGQTTKADLTEKLGNPVGQTYTQDGLLTANWMYIYVGPFGTGMEQQMLSVLFDEGEVVKKYSIVNP